MTNDSVIIQIGDEVIELTGAELDAFKAQRALDQKETKARQAEVDAKLAARTSALAKLAALGFTADEIGAL